MKWVRVVLLAGLFLVVTVRWPVSYTSWGVTPAWPFLLVLLLGLRARVQPAVVLSWCTGLGVDLLSLSPLGLHAFLFGLVALVLVRVRGHIFASHSGTQGVLAMVLTLIVTFTLLIRLSIAEPDFRMAGRVPAALLLSLLTGAAFPWLAAADRWLGLTEGFREGERVV